MIFLKWLCREWTQQTPWAQRHLAGRSICWQFDTADGQRYATLYEAAPPAEGATRTLHLRGDSIPVRLGMLGDGSHEFQAALTTHLVRWIEAAGVRTVRPARVQ